MKQDPRFKPHEWALILGASSGFGGAAAVEFARHGMNIFGVHLDRQATMPAVQHIIKEIRHFGREAVFYNINAADTIKQAETLDDIQERFSASPGGTVKVLMHSLAFGTLKPFIAKKVDEAVSQAQMEMTLDVMAHSLVYWMQGLMIRGLMKRGGRVFAMTSSGGHSVLPSYGAVSAAKAALESHVRQLAMELGPFGITANAMMAGVTDTPALRKIPGAVRMLEVARAKNPGRRLTTPEDVAHAMVLLCEDGALWVSGNVIGVDGGEDVVSYVGQKGE
ncbi:MAG: Short-chain dehydrogenase/reductase precursor [Bacteroidetes bacterium]|jgi:NAD(P)-dependent dehydrogenase (short-subunit alcohol dehydrogenase family)|nr:Short-chain dehydrogenase/reductase precursor [Bacteroidota bacterium]